GSAGARSHRPALPRKASRRAIPVGERARVQPRTVPAGAGGALRQSPPPARGGVRPHGDDASLLRASAFDRAAPVVLSRYKEAAMRRRMISTWFFVCACAWAAPTFAQGDAAATPGRATTILN